ncbi:MAG: PQQ-binding-like beta-propeller repeat protein [Thermoanaerobaculia bacterium]
MGDVVYAFSCSGIVFAFDKTTGAVRWTYDTKLEEGTQSTFHGEPVVTDELLIVAGDIGWVYAFELDTGRTRWKTLAGPLGIYGDLLQAGSLVAGSSSRGGFFALDLDTGAVLWKVEPDQPGSAMYFSSPVRLGERLYFAEFGSRVSSVVTETGEVAWTRDLEAELTTDLAAVDGGLVVGLTGGRLVRLDASTGRTTAAIELPEQVVGTPVHAGSALVLTDYSSFLHAVERDLSAVRWSQAGRWSSERVLVEDGAVVAGSADGELMAMDLDTGAPLWTKDFEGVIRGIGRSTDTYFVGVQAGTVYAFRRE